MVHDDSIETDLIWMRHPKVGVGRPASRTRTEVTEAAVRVADRDGLAGLSMRQVAAELGTGPGSLYRYVDNRDDLLDLVADHVAAEYDFSPPSGDWLDDLVDIGLQAREIYRRHPWLPELILTRPVVGPNGAELMEHFLSVVADHPADDDTKLVALAMLNTIVAATARTEAAPADALRSARYLAHVAADGRHPRLAAMRIQSTEADPFPIALRKVLAGLFS
ncbi:TetR family transcriptional regulator [Stackebrandtia endophytica]|uniref:TetR family transcriptional regulator n=1 Tax=Stackebrandtia endophytica TaxID=1496996 RepID=A0A543AVT6_9ACTN|nr:TetR/AcrR family transcriptional regulator [Stackebrandtia endophytica]TQL76674.1 TetR family transcriptional regulator [Stackebrandtia endophytica]